ncbi:MAG: MFS transporter [Solirubrobacteraceae bacterium]
MNERSTGASILYELLRFLRWLAARIQGEVVRRVGGPARARVVLLFGLVLALNGADTATVGAIAPELERGLHTDVTGIGVLSSAALLVGAVATIPVGLLVDKVKRIPVLSLSIVLWSVATMAGAFANSCLTLLLTRLALGAVVATAGPAIASLTGDYFPARERGRIYAYILGGEIAGNAFGFIISANVASAISWRASFILLGIPGFFLARSLYRTVPEPLRGGQSHLEPGVEDLIEAAAQARARSAGDWFVDEATQEHIDDLAREAARRLGVEADPDMVLNEDPRQMSLAAMVRYVLAIPTNMLMVISSSLGYFFFAGLSTFALLFVRGHYNVSQATSSLVLALLVVGAMVGNMVSGWLSDALLRRGWMNSRVVIPAVCYLAAAGLLIPGFVSTHLTPAIWFDVVGAGFLSAANPPLDAARLDIMPAGLWGRAESVRTVIRSLAQAIAPTLFGALAALVAGIAPIKQAPIGTHPPAVSASEARGLEIAFLVLLVTLVAAGLALLRARETYARDVATAGISNQGGDSAPPAGRSQSAARSATTDHRDTNRLGRNRRDSEW